MTFGEILLAWVIAILILKIGAIGININNVKNGKQLVDNQSDTVYIPPKTPLWFKRKRVK